MAGPDGEARGEEPTTNLADQHSQYGQYGLYLHVPFCRHRCDYCAFATWTDRDELIERYLAACRRQVVDAVAAGLGPITSVFVGGGTPTRVPADLLMAVLAEVPLAAGAEVSVECNPDDVTVDLLQAYRDGGVNRLSFGVQSMVPHVLAALGRTHDPANVRTATEAAHQVGLPFNVDIMYGAVGESMADWQCTVDEAVALGPAHVSAYGLTVEAGTPLAADPARQPDDDDQADKYLEADRRLGEAGFEWYEISNWAQAGQHCRHNLLYWTQGEYLGVGCAAHSHTDGRRWWNLHTPERYLAAIESGQSPEAAGEQLEPAAKRIEGLQLSLRTKGGVPADSFPSETYVELDGLLTVAGDRAHLTVDGRLLANEVALRLR